MLNFRLVAVVITATFLMAAGCSKAEERNNSNIATEINTNSKEPFTDAANNPAAKEVVAPISRASERVTKKPFGIYITKQNSPVQPEKFTGYHSGTDFETFPEEKDTDVAVNAICTGKLSSKRTATGYGGVATQSCAINGQSVTVIYGHVRLSSITAKVGDELKAGQQFAVLGTGFSSETDGERKHLHLGIVKGQSSDIRGYVQQSSGLDSFLDITKLF